ncbi:putative secreted protein (Por secretion system target) [Kordia periserrulae]|uniref:Putative secreted protein (Por secretion system target) n=1 Tax=Kordia periserrulae TaxID=701523 RepID=A0A2T6BWF7_9FLAO|nr:SdrD B-like domain-containing protein [Kordia periserrulae]PTX60412.1 putative secreted protein (Por secretion system target) [Kordia periserrulae]
MKTKITLSAIALFLACLTLNAVNTSSNKSYETLPTANVEENASATVDLHGFIFEFLGVQYNLDGTSTWTYKVTGNGARRSLSHWKLKLYDDHTVNSASPNTWEAHVDPHFQYYGIKWDSSVNKNGGMKTFSFTLDGRYDIGEVDFGYKAGRKLFHGTILGPTNPLTSSISGTVFNDTNANGVLDGVERFLPNVQVNLYDDVNGNGVVDAGEPLLETQITDGVGGYIFSNTSAINVIVVAELPSNTIDFTYQATTPLTNAMFVTTGDITNIDFGIKRTQIQFYDISGVVYDDNNENAMNDNEAGLAGVEVNLYNDANANGSLEADEILVSTTTTDANGAYIFTQVMFTHVIVEAVKPRNTAAFDYVATTDSQEAITMLNQNIIDVNFGINETQLVNYNISGNVFDDNDANGVADLGEDALENISITLYVDNDNDGTVTFADTVIASTTTAADGTYSFSNVTVQNTLVSVTVPLSTTTFTYVLTTADVVNTSSATTDVTNADFGINKELIVAYNIFGTVYDDENENATLDTAEAGRLENVTITLFVDENADGRVGTDDTVIATTTTAADGTYEFLNVTVQNTVVAVTVPSNDASYSYALTTDARREISSVDTDVVDVNFGISKTALSFNVTGNVFNDGDADGMNAPTEAGLSGVVINLFDDLNQNGRVDRGEPLIATTTSDRSGNYQFTGITATNVIVQVIIPANTPQYTYTPTTPVSVVVTGGASTTIDFGINRQLVVLYNVSGLVWDDANSDQQKDLFESRLEGIAVTLYEDANANGTLDTADRSLSTITTSATGFYQFSNVNLPNVLVIPTLPSNGTFTTPDSRAISSINTNAIDVDFGIKIASTLYQVTGVVFDDQNANGIFDDGEGTIDGLPVEIYADTDLSGTFDPNLDLLVAFTQTSNNGFGFLNPNYLVDDIPGGQVFIVVIIPEDTIFTTYTPTFDPDSGTTNPDGVYPTVMNANLVDINFGIKVEDVNSTSRAANEEDVLFTDGSTINTAVEDVSENLRLYPNPTVKEIAINADEFAGDVTVEIYNDRGYQVLNTTVSSFGSEYKVDVQRLAPGMYYAKFTSRNKVASKKFIKK